MIHDPANENTRCLVRTPFPEQRLQLEVVATAADLPMGSPNTLRELPTLRAAQTRDLLRLESEQSTLQHTGVFPGQHGALFGHHL